MGGETPDLAPAEPDPNLPPAEQQTQYEQNLAQWQGELDAARAETGTPVTVGMVLMLLWAAGAALLGLWLVGVNLRFRRALGRSRKSLAVEGFPLPVYVTGAVPTPCLFGLVRPAVYVTPETAADGTVLRHSLAHELTHFHHRDHLWAALRGLCLALHWYNPLVWLAASLSRRDGELCCDEATVKRLGEAERAAYGRTLLAVTCQGRADPLLTATSMTGGKGIQERIVLLAKRPKTAARSLALVVLVAAAAAGCTFTGAEEDGFVPDRVSMGQSLSSTMGSTITDPETVARLWDLYQGFTLGEPADPDDVWTLSVRFSAEDTEEMAGFDLTRDGLYSTDRETYYVLEDGAELYQEFYGVYEEQQARDREAELSREEDEPSDTYLTSADLDRDGEDETISVVQESQQIWQLVVTKADGTELFREEAGTPHIAWNSLYLCRDDQNGDCLLCYNPYASTGFASYSYTLFTLEGGVKTVIQEGRLDFEIRQVPERAEELMAFADEVNALLRHSSLLLSTQGGEVMIGPAGWGEYLMHLSGLGDFLTEAEPVADTALQPAVPTPESSYRTFEATLSDPEPIGGVVYTVSTMFHYDAPHYRGSVWTAGDQRVPAGYLTARSMLYNGDKQLVCASGASPNASDTSFHYQETPELTTNDTTLYLSGTYEIHSGSGRIVRGTAGTVRYENGACAAVRPVTLMEEDGVTGYPVSAGGLIYGSLLYAGELGEMPDLISAVGTNGAAGYILREDFAPELYTQAAVEDWLAALEENNRIPLYDLEGNPIGEFVLGVPQGGGAGSIPAKEEKLWALRNAADGLEGTDLPALRDYQLPAGVRQSIEAELVDGQYPANAAGETYGTLWAQYVVGYPPDLIAVVGAEGEDGYVYAREYQSALRAGGETVLTVYNLAGAAVDRFVVGD